MKYGLRCIAILCMTAATTLSAAGQSSIPPPDPSVTAGEKAVATFVTQDSTGDVQLGQLGLRKAVNPSVRALARAMVADHTRTAAIGASLAAHFGADAEKKPESTNQMDLTHLARYSGSQFDRAYLKTLVDAHKSDIAGLKDALEYATDPALRAALRTVLAVDAKHLRMALAAQQLVGTSG
jgi:putative membrane protein